MPDGRHEVGLEPDISMSTSSAPTSAMPMFSALMLG
jgi:hypothetical protein